MASRGGLRARCCLRSLRSGFDEGRGEAGDQDRLGAGRRDRRPTGSPSLASAPLYLAAALISIGLTAVVLVLFLLPIGSSPRPQGRPRRRFDERDIVFARARLRPGSPELEAHYQRRPEHRKPDDKVRTLPGLLSPGASKAEPLAFAAARSSFRLTELLRDEVDGPVATAHEERSPEQWSRWAKEFLLHHGAQDAGIAALEPYHVYSHVGRGTGTWGEPIEIEHSWAIAFTVEMDQGVMASAPEAPVVMESARQYLSSGTLAVRLATMMRGFGYPARAHIDGNYRVIAPLVARDAGLGEIGRMGLLMTPRLGPRVRLGVVTTDVPLVADAVGDDPSVLDFCTICRKCADNCPTAAIPKGGPEPLGDARRWRLNAELCFSYWNAVGTDCGRCMTVCPYSHPDSWAHRPARWAIARSGAARRAMLFLDHAFYGRRPVPRPTRKQL